MEVTWIAILAGLCMGIGAALIFVFAVAGILNPILAAGAMLLSSISVIVNSMRLLRVPAN